MLKSAIAEDKSELWNKPELKSFKPIKYELTNHDGVILRGQRIIIPKKLQVRTVELAHKGHQGISKTKGLLRSKVWFPKIYEIIENIKHCAACQATDARKRRDPLQLQEFLLSYRNTLHCTTSRSPCELVYKWRVNDLLPKINEVEAEPLPVDFEKRVRRKEYADAKRKVVPNNLREGDMVLCQQKKKNVLTPRYDPRPFRVTKVEGTKKTAERDGHCIVRNASFFKIFKEPVSLQLSLINNPVVDRHPTKLPSETISCPPSLLIEADQEQPLGPAQSRVVLYYILEVYY